MISAAQVACFFLATVDEDIGDGISNLKLQKLVYYAQAYHLANYDEPLFPEPVEAWEHGPVVPELYHHYKAYGSGHIPAPTDFDPADYDERTTELLDEIWDTFGQYSAWKLRNITHEDRPWIEAHLNGSRARSRTISHGAMRDFYRAYLTE